MSTQLIVPPSEIVLPALIERAGKRTLVRFAEFFTVHISNANTRQAYARALKSFLAWCEQRGVTEIAGVQPLHVASYREVLRQEGYSVPTVKGGVKIDHQGGEKVDHFVGRGALL
jgi:hypothetical protein